MAVWHCQIQRRRIVWLGDHPIAEDLRALGMGETAVERLYAPQVQSMLHPASERLPLM